MRWSTGIILLVDGDDEFLRTVRESLAVTDYTILHATTAQEAVSVLSRLRYTVDLLVIDLELPDKTGLGIFGLLATPECHKASRIIAKTSRQDESFLGQVYWLGIDAIVRKPTSAEQLVGTVHAVLNERPKWFC